MDCETVMLGGEEEMVGVVPVVVLPSSSSQMKIFPVRNQSLPVVSESVAFVLPLSFRPLIFMVKVCGWPSQSIGSHGVSSI